MNISPRQLSNFGYGLLDFSVEHTKNFVTRMIERGEAKRLQDQSNGQSGGFAFRTVLRMAGLVRKSNLDVMEKRLSELESKIMEH